MEKGRNYSTMIMVAIFALIFLGSNVAFAANFKKLMEGESFLAKSKKEGKIIVDFMQFKKGQYFEEGISIGYYEFSNDKLFYWDKGEKKSNSILLTLVKKEDVVYMVYQGATIASYHPVPVGYLEIREIQANNNAGKTRNVISLSKKLLKKKKVDSSAGIAASEFLLQNGEFQAAAKGFEFFGKKGKVELCRLMEIAVTKKIPKGFDVTKTAKVAWTDNIKENPGLEFLIYRAEAIAYACALAEKYELAADYQVQLYQHAQRQQIIQLAKVREAKIDVPGIDRVAVQYQSKKRPKVFKASVL